MMKNGQFSASDIATVQRECAKLNQQLLYAPQNAAADELRLTTAFGELIRAYDEGREAEFFAQYPYKVTPTTDDAPFFFETSSIFDGSNWSWNSLRGSGVQSTLFAIASLSTVTMLVAILLPLRVFAGQGLEIDRSAAWSAYFASLGFGFMMIEIGLRQKYVLLLGNPMYSLPIILATLLIAAGLGSGASLRWRERVDRKIAIVWVGVLVYVGFMVLAFPRITSLVLPLSLAARCVATIVLIFPVGVLLGMPFPGGLDALKDRGASFIPWAWGINGSASVFGSVLAIVTAMYGGFTLTLAAGVMAYACALTAAHAIARPAARAVRDALPA